MEGFTGRGERGEDSCGCFMQLDPAVRMQVSEISENGAPSECGGDLPVRARKEFPPVGDAAHLGTLIWDVKDGGNAGVLQVVLCG